MDSSRRRRRPFSLEFQQAPPGPGLVHAESRDTRRTDPIGAGIDGSSKKFRRYTFFIHLAAGEGASKVAEKLVELGADVKRADRQGRNALDIARAAGYYDLEARLRLLSET